MDTQAQLQVLSLILQSLEHSIPVTLLYVVESDGSSPGRQGFFMAATEKACMGTIGGGIMEFKLVELCREMIRLNDAQPKLITQYHDKTHATNQSGMICSGMQRVVIVPLRTNHESIINTWISVLQNETTGQVTVTPESLSFSTKEGEDWFKFETETSWRYQQTINLNPKLHIIGAGHVSLALSDLMAKLGFYVIVYDDRPQLNTLDNNRSASKKHLVSYDTIGTLIEENASEYVVIMTIGYRSDKIVLTQLINKSWRYIGMLGSRAKMNKLYEELVAEGWPVETLKKLNAPIGLPIHSQTTEEIAVSIAAEIIRERRKGS